MGWKRCRLLRVWETLFLLTILAAWMALPAQQTRAQAAVAIPEVELNVPADGMIGEEFTFSVSFDNAVPLGYTGSAAGFGPYIDLIFPATGIDGDDGISFTSASYLGAALTPWTSFFPGPGPNGCVDHPYAVDVTGAPLPLCGKTGDQVVVLLLPFGSFVPEQPPAVVTVRATLSDYADLNQPLTIQAGGGFQFGDTPLNDYTTDPSIIANVVTDDLNPTLVRLAKTSNAPEAETVSGKNFPRRYRVSMDIADGQSLSSPSIVDDLPPKIEYLRLVDGYPAGWTAVDEPATPLPQLAPDNRLQVTWPSLTGGPGAEDAWIEFEFDVVLRDANASQVIPPVSGDDVSESNHAQALGEWDPIDPDDPLVSLSNVTSNSYVLSIKSIDIQKSPTIAVDANQVGNSPGDVLEYVLVFHISDFFAMQDLFVEDVISDGQHFDDSYSPRLAIQGNDSINLPEAGMNLANFTVDTSEIGNDTDPATDGSTKITFRVSGEMITRGVGGSLLGGCIPPGGMQTGVDPSCANSDDGPTTGTIRYRTIVQDHFSDTYLPNNAVVDQGDVLNNTVTVDGAVLDVDTLDPTGLREADTSNESLEISRGALSKSIYAVNGSPPTTNPVEVAPGGTLTYRLTYVLYTSDVENLTITDYLPLPVLRAVDFAAFDNQISAAAPASGHAHFGPADTYHDYTAIVPSVIIDPEANTILFDYGDGNGGSHLSSTIDLLFTLPVTSDPFTDRLFLTNQARVHEGSTNSLDYIADSIIQIVLTEPVLAITKGFVWADSSTSAVFAPAAVSPVSFAGNSTCSGRFSGTLTSTGLLATPVQSDVSGLDAGDEVLVAIIVENTGSGLFGAYDVRVGDTLPAGMEIVEDSLCVSDGTGAAIAYTGDETDFLDGTGIELVDPGDPVPTRGSIARYSDTGGENLAVITYQARLASSVPPDALLDNTAHLFWFAGAPGGVSHVVNPMEDTAQVSTILPEISKIITGSGRTFTAGNALAVGETVSYEVQVTIPEGTTPAAALVDTLPQGLAFVSCDSISASAGISAANGLSCTNAVFSAQPPASLLAVDQGRVMTISLGDLTNANSDNATAETLTIQYTAVAINSAYDQDTLPALRNTAQWTWDGGAASTQGPGVTIAEPGVTVDKTANPTSGDAGDSITFSIDFANPAGATRSDAFEVRLADDLSALDLTLTGISLPPTFTNCAGYTNYSNVSTADVVDVTIEQIPPGCSVHLSFTATLDVAVQPNQLITNTASLTYSSLPGVVNGISSHSALACERTGSTLDCGGLENNYTHSDGANVTVTSPALVKSRVDTSASHTLGGSYAVGEIVRFRIQAAWPEGTTADAQIADILPSTLTYINGSARAAFVCTGGGSCMTASGAGLNDAALMFDSSITPVASVTPTFLLPDSAVSTSASSNSDTYVGGTAPRFKFGTLVTSDSDADVEYVVIEFDARVQNDSAVNAGASANNLARAYKNGTTQVGGNSNSVSGTIVEPAIPFNSGENNKTASFSSPDAGDLVDYTVTFQNDGVASLADAFEVRLQDDLSGLPVTLTGSPAFAYSGCTPQPVPTNNSAGSVIDVTFDRMAANCQVTVTYQVTLNGTVSPRQALTNTANLTYTTLPGDGAAVCLGSSCPGASGSLSGERNGTGTNPPNDLAGSDTALVSVAAESPAKVIDLTSEAASGLVAGTERVMVGEVVRYRALVAWPEGQASSVVLVDDLPSGMMFLNNTAKLALVSNASCPTVTFDSSTLLDAPWECGDLSTLDGINPTFDLPDDAVSSSSSSNEDTYVDGTAVYFKLGNLDNRDRDFEAETILLEFNVLALNADGNQAGTALANSIGVSINGALTGSSTPVNVILAEPALIVEKSVLSSPGDTGDSVTYRIAVRNDSGDNVTPAYEIVVNDPLNASLDLRNEVGNVTISAPGGVVTQDNSDPATDLVQVSLSHLDPGQSATIDVVVHVRDEAITGSTIQNTATARFSSLPGTNGTTGNATGSDTPGANGSPTGERDGETDPTTRNDYRASDSASVLLAQPAVDKRAPADAEYTIGETAVFNILVTLPEGTTNALRLTDNIPSGMEYASHEVITNHSLSDGLLSQSYNGMLAAPPDPVPSGEGNDLELTFGDTVTIADNIAANNTFIVRVTLTVLNVEGNQNGGTKINQADLSYSNGAQTVTLSDTANITIVEPELEVNKTVSNSAPRFGETVTYTITLQHLGSSRSDAYDLVLEDTLPAGMTYVPIATFPAGWTLDVSGLPTLRFTKNSLTAVEGAQTFTYQAQLAMPPALNLRDVLTNAVALRWTSLSGIIAGERTGAGEVNDYLAQSSRSATVTGPDVSVSKTDGADSYIPGASVTYTIVVTNIGNESVSDATVVDSFPAEITSASWTCVASASSNCDLSSGTGNINTTVDLAVSGTATFTVTAATNPATTTNLVNSVTTALPGLYSDPTPANNTATDTDTPDPRADLSVTKSDGSATYSPGVGLTYTIVVANSGPSDAPNALVSDARPAQISTWAWACSGVTGGASGCDAQASSTADFSDTVNLPAGSSITYSVTVAILSSASGSLENTVTVAAQGGVTDPTPGNNSATDTDTSSPLLDLSVTKTDGVSTYIPGQTVLTYTIVVANSGPSDALNASLSDTRPAQIASWAWSCSEITGGASSCDGMASASSDFLDLINLPVGASMTYTVTAQTASSGAGDLTNTAIIAPATGATDSNPANNSASDTDSAAPQADLSVTKTDGGATYVPGAALVYTIVVTNAGPSDVVGATVSDARPALISSWAWTCAGASGGASGCDGMASSVSAFSDTLDLPLGASITYTVTAQTASSVAGDLANTVTVAGPVGVTDPDLENNSATDTDTPAPQVDLSVTKTDGVSVYTPGQSGLVYTIVVSNSGPSDALSAIVSDLRPAQISTWTWVCSGTDGGASGCDGMTSAAANFSDTVNLPLGASITYTVTAQTASSAAGDLTNSVTIAPAVGTVELDSADNTASDTDTASPRADLSITKTDNVLTYSPGGTLTYIIVVVNNGPSDVSGASIWDARPAQISTWAWACSGATGGASGCTPMLASSADFADLVNLPTGGTITYTVTASIPTNAADDLLNTVTVAPPVGIVEAIPGNNIAQDTDTFSPAADLEIIKAAQTQRFVPGGLLVYVLTVINHGPSDALGVVVNDTLPSEVSYVSATPEPDDQTSGVLTWNLGGLNAGDQVDLWLTVRVGVAVTTPFANTAQVSCTTGELELVNNEDDFTVQPNEPTAVTLLYFRAKPLVRDQVLLEWAVAADLDGFGYRLVRAENNNFARAEEIYFTPAILPGGGYQYLDAPPEPGEWWYWLVRVSTSGSEEVIGPVSLVWLDPGERPYHTHLPLLWR